MKNADMPAMPPNNPQLWADPKDTSRGTVDAYGLTKREHACIALRVPETGDPELDALIRTAQRRDVAAMAMLGMLSSNDPSVITAPAEHHSMWAAGAADALLAALEPKP